MAIISATRYDSEGTHPRTGTSRRTVGLTLAPALGSSREARHGFSPRILGRSGRPPRTDGRAVSPREPDRRAASKWGHLADVRRRPPPEPDPSPARPADQTQCPRHVLRDR